jgi:type IV secretory pathway VirB9-like protein
VQHDGQAKKNETAKNFLVCKKNPYEPDHTQSLVVKPNQEKETTTTSIITARNSHTT